MPEPVAKIVQINTDKLVPTGAGKNSPENAWNGTSEVAFIVGIEHEGQTYNRKLRFVLHDQKVNHIGSALTVADVEQAIMAEVETIKSLHEVAAALTAEVNVDQVAKIAARPKV